jgi:hypothetical protein
MNIHSTILIAVAGATLLLGGCGERSESGPMVSDTREVEAFDAIEVKGAAKLEITIGEPLSVVIKGHENAVRRVETSVHGDTLRIKSRPKDWLIRNHNSRLTLQITLPHLQSLNLEGGNDVLVVGFAGGKTNIDASGAAHIQADGHLEQLTVHLAGAGHADLSKLSANEAKVTVDGVGSVIVNPRDSLDATMNGVGAIFYTGSPSRVSTRMNGLGTIGQREEHQVESEGVEPKKQVDPETLQPELEESEPVDYKKNHTAVI